MPSFIGLANKDLKSIGLGRSLEIFILSGFLLRFLFPSLKLFLKYILDLHSRGFKTVFNPFNVYFYFVCFKIKNIQIP